MTALTLTHFSAQQLSESVAKIKSLYPHTLDVMVILGSGLGDFAERLENKVVFPYEEIPHFCKSAVEGHAGNFVLGTLPHVNGTPVHVACMQGRFHYYEGHDMQTVTFPVRVAFTLGAKHMLVTNAAGGINTSFKPGTLMLINDHLNMTGDHPLKGPNAVNMQGLPIGPRFPDMTHAYNPVLLNHLKTLGEKENIALETGVYAGLSGPSYETPAEIRMLRTLGADAVGMSTVPEVIVANHMGMKVAGISCITNAAAGITGEALTHDEVTETANLVRAQFMTLVHQFLLTMPLDV